MEREEQGERKEKSRAGKMELIMVPMSVGGGVEKQARVVRMKGKKKIAPKMDHWNEAVVEQMLEGVGKTAQSFHWKARKARG